jgi:NAD(P)-dependent dehydrogenase (short-subunit alcohol dehydrogenase family)
MGVLSGLTCVVTGASGGMGRQLAIQLCQDNCRVAICDIRLDELEETKRLCLRAQRGMVAERISTHVCDVTNEADVERLRDEVLAAHGGTVQVLINNAGIASSGSFLDMPKGKFDKVFDVSWQGVVLCTRAFLPHIIKAKRGYITNLSSINAFWSTLGPATWPTQTPPHAAYCAVRWPRLCSRVLRVRCQCCSPSVSQLCLSDPRGVPRESRRSRDL